MGKRGCSEEVRHLRKENSKLKRLVADLCNGLQMALKSGVHVRRSVHMRAFYALH